MCESCGVPNLGSVGERAGVTRHAARIAAAATAKLQVAACAGPASAPSPDADLVLYNGTIIQDPLSGKTAEAIAIRGNRIVAVGDRAEVVRQAGRDTEQRDLQGRTVTAGLIDSHLHQYMGAMEQANISLLEARDLADVVAAIDARVTRTPAGQWVCARGGWHESLLAEARLPTRAELDPVSPNNPVFIPRGGHVVTVNSEALRIAGITRDTPDPDGGVIVRDANGEPTGVLLESAAQLVRGRLPAPPDTAEQQRLLRQKIAEHAALGITSVTEPGLTTAQYEQYVALRQAGRLDVRAHILLWARSLTDVETVTASMLPRSGDDMLRLDGFKIAADGGVEGAYLHQPYQIVPGEQPNSDYVGTLNLPSGGAAELARMYVAAARHGFQFQTHAVGDAAFDHVVRALELADGEIPLAPHRFAIMHLFLPSGAGLASMKRMGIIATVQDHPVLLGNNQLRWWGADRAARAIPIRTILDAGITTGGGTDAPVCPPSPLWSMGWMTTRKTLRGNVLGAEQAITPAEALHLYTIGSAYTQFAEDCIGSLVPGKLADLVVLDGNPLTVPADEIRDIQVMLTMVDGRTVYER